ncbi:MAG: hypothetical protein M3063_12950 [Actinomycetota bacterium]|nr:hypothetical protein [Actinomycetota bacterium]
MSLQDPWSPATPPPPPSRPDRRPWIFGAVGAVVLVIVVVVVVIVATQSSHPASTTTASTGSSTTAAGGSPGLLDAVPSAFRDDCSYSANNNYLDNNATTQVACIGSSVPDAAIVVYGQYDRSTDAESYYSGTLLNGNGMVANAGGKCSALQLTGKAPNGTYCEESVKNAGSSTNTGHTFTFAGTSFSLGSGANVAKFCGQGGAKQGFSVVGWTDDPTKLSALAVTCNSQVSSALASEKDYFAGKYDLVAGG